MIVALFLSMAFTPPAPRCIVREIVAGIPGRCRAWGPQ